MSNTGSKLGSMPAAGETHGNLALITEARTTEDPARQIALAQHPSGIAHRALRENPKLCSEAAGILDRQISGEVTPSPDTLRALVDQVREMTKKV